MTVADRLIDAGVVGWFNGRAEFGPRPWVPDPFLPTRAEVTQKTFSTQKSSEGEFSPLCAFNLKGIRERIL
jgi:predicted NodU family carbamoyl transferase